MFYLVAPFKLYFPLDLTSFFYICLTKFLLDCTSLS